VRDQSQPPIQCWFCSQQDYGNTLPGLRGATKLLVLGHGTLIGFNTATYYPLARQYTLRLYLMPFDVAQPQDVDARLLPNYPKPGMVLIFKGHK